MPNDILSALLSGSLGKGSTAAADATAPEGNADQLGFTLAALQALQAPPQRSGPIGQIAQAIMPFALAPMFAQQVRQDQATAELAREKRQMDREKMQIEMAKTLAETKKLNLEADPDASMQQALKTLDTLTGGKGTGSLPQGSTVKFDAGPGASITLRGEPFPSGIEKLGSSIGALGAAIEKGQVRNFVTKLPDGTLEISTSLPQPTQTKFYEQSFSAEQLRDNATKLRNILSTPEGQAALGASGKLNSFLAGAGFQLDQMRKTVQKEVLANPNIKDTSARWFKDLFNPKAGPVDILRTTILYESARAIGEQTAANGVSDRDIKKFESFVGSEWAAYPEDIISRMDTLIEMADEKIKRTNGRLNYYVGSDGQPITTMSVPKLDPKTITYEDAAAQLVEHYKQIKTPERDIDRLVGETLAAQGFK